MKKIISLLISFTLLFTQAAPAFSQVEKRPSGRDLSGRLDMKDLVAVRDALANTAQEERFRIIDAQVERMNKIRVSKQNLNILFARVEKAHQSTNFEDFFSAVGETNALLLSYLSDPLTENRFLGAATLAENLRLHLITPQDAEKAYNAFEQILKRADFCTGLQCDFLSASARGLAHSRKFHELEKEFVLAGVWEVMPVAKTEANRQRRLNLLKALVSRHYGSDESNAQIVLGVLPAVAAMGSVNDVAEAVSRVVNPALNWVESGKNRSSYKPQNMLAQIAAMDVLLKLGPSAQPVLKKYAFNQHSFVSYVHANINLAYTQLGKEEDKRNKGNLHTLYCHRDFNVDSREELGIHQKLAYAYGRGQELAYITPAGDSSCLVIVPTEPDPKKVAEEWTNIVMGEVVFQMAFFGLGTVISGIKNGVRALKHYKTIQYIAATRKMSVGTFLVHGGMKKLPTFGMTLAQARAAKETKALAALVGNMKTVKEGGNASTALQMVQDASGVAITKEAATARVKTVRRFSKVSSGKGTGPIRNRVTREVVKNNLIYMNPAYSPRVPVLSVVPKANPVTKRFPSGMWDEEGIVARWLDQHKNGYFHPRNQIEAITGMSAKKANNVTEYLYYMSLDEAKETILNPLIRSGRLPDFIYDSRLIEGTRRLPAGYYKNKFNSNVNKMLSLAEEEGSVYTKNLELSDIITGMSDYSFAQGFSIPNDIKMTAGLRKNWKMLVDEVERRGLRADAKKLNELWSSPVETGILENKFAMVNGKYLPVQEPRMVSLQDYFSQTRSTVFFKEGAQPEFFLNSKKWLSWENERRNLAAANTQGFSSAQQEGWWDRVQNWFVLGDRKNYLTLDEFGEVMTLPYRRNATFAKERSLSKIMTESGADLPDSAPSSLKIKINNYEVTGGACQAAITDGGACYKPREGYDGTSLIDRFQALVNDNVKAVVFDVKSLSPRVVTIKSVPHVKDMKPVDVDLVRASSMVADRLDASSDLLRVQKADAALRNIPNLRATIYPKSRLAPELIPEGLNGGGIGAYLTLYTPDFYPLKTVYRMRFNGFLPKLERQYFIRKEVPALSGAIHRDRLTFFEQVADRVVP